MKQAADVEIPAEALADYFDTRDTNIGEPEIFISNAAVIGWLKTWGTAEETMGFDDVTPA
jgi:hypothetical protein